MRSRGPAADGRVAHFPDQDRLAELQCPLADRDQPPAVGDAFHEGHHDLDIGPLYEVGDPVEQAQVRFIARRNRVIAAHAEVGSYRDHAEAEAAALRHHRHRSRLEGAQLRRAAEADARVVLEVEDAKTVRPDHAHVCLARRFHQLLLQCFAFCADLGVAAGEDERERDSGFAALLDGSRGLRSGERDEREIAGLGHREQIGVALQPVHLRVAGVHRIDLSLVAEIGEQLQRLPANARGLG